MRWVVAIFILLPNITFGSVIITEIFHDPDGGNESGKEFVEIFNSGSQAYDLSGLELNIDEGRKKSLIQISNIEPGEYIILNNTNLDPNLTLYNGSGDHSVRLIDTATYIHKTENEGKSLQKQLDGTWVVGAPTPGEGPFTTGDTQDTGTTTQVNEVITTYKEVTRWETVEIQPPQDIIIREVESKVVLLGSELYIQPEIFDATGKAVGAKCQITFGDGAESPACDTKHLYQFVGKYVLNISASKNSMQASTRVPIDVINPDINILVSGGGDYVELINNLDTDIELNGWKIRVEHKRFNIPNRTIISAKSSIKISARTMKIDINRYGGVANLVNAFGKSVTDSTIETLVEGDAQELVEQTVAEQVAGSVQEDNKESEEAIDVVEGFSIESREVLSNSIIGMQVIVEEASEEQDKQREKEESGADNRIEQIVELPESQVAAAGSIIANNTSPSDLIKWIVGLLAIMGIAIIPVIIRKREDDIDT